MPYFGALEAGGTKMVCAVVSGQGEVMEQTVLPTRCPEETVPELLAFFRGKPLAAMGIGCFGPVGLDRRTPQYGSILATPKTAWRGFPIAACFREALGVPVGFDTDVNAAALGEWAWGGAQGLDTAAYLTVGTGVGLGIVVGGRPYHGMLHPEGGHLPIARRADDPLARGICPFHPNCLEGLASGPSIEARWGRPARELAGQGAVWELEAFYLAQALCAYIMVLSPERIILGGGVMRQAQLFPLIRAEVRRQLGGYISGGGLAELEQYIVPASLGDSQGVLGAAQLAADAYKENGGRV